jgi:hypothetical protein
MEHIKVIDLSNDMVKLTPYTNYMLLDSRSKRLYSEAIINNKDMKYFSAVIA